MGYAKMEEAAPSVLNLPYSNESKSSQQLPSFSNTSEAKRYFDSLIIQTCAKDTSYYDVKETSFILFFWVPLASTCSKILSQEIKIIYIMHTEFALLVSWLFKSLAFTLVMFFKAFLGSRKVKAL